MRIRVLLQNGLLSLLLVSFLGFIPEVLQAVQAQQDEQAFQAVTLADTQNTVEGQVTDSETNEPLPGVNIVIQGSSIGTVTDENGNYNLAVPSLNETLVVSYIGFQTQEIAINGRSSINIGLEGSVVIGEEMVVTAFGFTRQRASLGYSTAEIQGEQMTRAREVNVANALSGRMAGVNVQGNNTGPGGSSRVIIRGNTSLAGNNQPLYVVDGMPINNSSQGSQGSSGRTVYGDRGDGISHINPDDIESMTVLKGGQATALYGSRASNGVILITTKQGSAREGIGIEFNSNTQFETIAKYPDWQQEYGHGASGVRPQTHSDSQSSGRLSFGERMDGQPYISVNGNMRPYSPVSVKDNMNNFYRLGSTYTNTLAFTGGSETYNYRLSMSNLDANAMMPNSDYNRKTANLNLNADVSNRISVGATVQYNVVEATNRPKGGYATYNANWGVSLLSSSLDIRDLSPGYNEDGTEMRWNPSSAAPNPYWVTNRYLNEDDESRLIGNVNIEFDLMDNLILQGSIGRDVRDFNAGYVVPTGTAFAPLGEYDSEQSTRTETNSLVTLNYMTPILENFNLQAMAGANREHHFFRSNTLSGSDFVIPYFYSHTNLATSSPGKGYSEQSINSLFGSTELDYKRIVYLTVTGRQDWFSTLNPEQNSIFYPSIGGSVLVSEAIQMPDAIDFLKLRASWARIGAATVGPYAVNASYGFRSGGFNGQAVQNPSGIPTPNLRPLENTTLEAGFDMQFLGNRLALDLSVYKSTTKDDIVSTQIARSSGFTETRVNVGELENKGIEFMIRGNPLRTSSFIWDISYNVSYNRSEILKLAEGLDQITIGSDAVGAASVRHMIGRPYGTVWGHEYLTNDEGQIVYDRNSGLPERVLEEQGLGVPPLTMGLSNDFNYKNFSLSILLDAKFGGVLSSNTEWYAYRFGLPKETLAGRGDGLHLSGVDLDGQPFERTIAHEDLRAAWYNNGGNYSGRFVHNNDFVKLREIVFSYNLPTGILEFARLQSASVSIVGRNLLSLYDPIPHIDPESSNTSDNAQGLEGFGLPRSKSLGVNVSLNF